MVKELVEIGLKRPWSIKKQIENKIDHEFKIEKVYSFYTDITYRRILSKRFNTFEKKMDRI